MSIHQSLISPTANPELERACASAWNAAALAGRLGELEPLAVRLGLIQATLTPKFRDPTLVLFAADHGLAVDGIAHCPTVAARGSRPCSPCNTALPSTVFSRATRACM